jgi:hypothetical protein
MNAERLLKHSERIAIAPGTNACYGHFGKTKYPFLRKRNQCFAEEAGRRPNLRAIIALNAAHFP